MNTAVIGGGLGGLVTAVLLAERGVRVTVFERSRALGGRARTTNEGGFQLNFGPRAIYRGGPAERMLIRIGVKPEGAPPRTKGFLLHEGRLHTLPAGPLSLLGTGFLDTRATWEAARLMARLGGLEADGDETVGAWLDRSTAHPRVRALVATFLMLGTYTYPVEALRARDALAQLKAASGPGVLYLHRGWQTLVDGVAARARKLGVAIHTSAKISRVRVEQGDCRAIELDDGSERRFGRIAIAAGLHTAASLVPTDAALARAAERARPVEMACLDVALERPTRPATILLGVDQPYYASVHSAVARLAPKESSGAVVHVGKYLAPGATGSETELRGVLELLQPGAVVTQARFLPRLVVMNARPLAADGGLEGRISEPDTRGLAVVGDWVGARGMLLDAVLASAAAAADRLAPLDRIVANG